MNDSTAVTLSLRIDWSEMDLFGHVNNVSYFKYIQASRVNCWEKIGVQKLFEQENKGGILASVKMDFVKPLHFPGNIEIKCKIEFVGNSSFGIHHQIFNDKNELCAEAHDVMVFYDFNTNQKMDIPFEIKMQMEKLD